MYGYKCEYCDGVVRERVVERGHLSIARASSSWKTYRSACAMRADTGTTTILWLLGWWGVRGQGG